MELTFYQQSVAFMYSVLLGLALGVIYGVLKIIRIAFFSNKISVFISDIFFMLVAAMSVFYFSLAFLYGYIRIYVFIGCITGFLLYRCTLGKVTSMLYCPLINFIKKILGKIKLKLKKITKKLLKIANKILYNILTKMSIFKDKHLASTKNEKVMTGNGKRNSKSKKKSGISG